MPRGIPKNKNLNSMKETIDNKNEPSTFSPNQPGLGLAASIEEKKAAHKYLEEALANSGDFI
jgi:hypothetical protein